MLEISYSRILRMAIPLMASSFIQSVVMLTDSSFLSRYDTISFDAAGNGGLLYVTLYVAIMGMSDGSQILMARRIGEQKESILPQIMGSAMFINTIIAIILFTASYMLLPQLIDYWTENKLIAEQEIKFVQIRSYGLFFSMIALVLNAYFMAIGRTGIVLISSVIIATTNIFLDYSLIFGNFGLPEMGLEGAAIASDCADLAGLLFMLAAVSITPFAKKVRLIHNLKITGHSIKNLFRMGSPIMLQGLVALITWTIFFIWIEQMGTHELTVSQNIRSLYFLSFVPVWGFAATTKTYISQYVGSKQFDKVSIIQRKIQYLTLGFLFLLLHGTIFYPEYLVSIVNNNPLYIKDSAEILRFISGSLFIFGFFSVYFNSISGMGNTSYTFIIEVISVGVYIASSYLFIKVFEWDIFYVWIVEYIYFITLGLLSIGYLRFFNWKKVKYD